MGNIRVGKPDTKPDAPAHAGDTPGQRTRWDRGGSRPLPNRWARGRASWCQVYGPKIHGHQPPEEEPDRSE